MRIGNAARRPDTLIGFPHTSNQGEAQGAFMIRNITDLILKKFLKYEPLTGDFRWLVYRNNQVKIGSVSGGNHPDGYIQIKLMGTMYLAHRLAWLYMTGEFPEFEIDHIDRDKSNNSWDNLRSATHSKNMRNFPIRKDNTSGKTGVCFYKSKRKWIARINNNNNKRITIGSFSVKQDAIDARIAAEKEYGY